MSELNVKDLVVNVDGNQILKGLNINIKAGEVHALMGPNGSGKSTLSKSVMGHPDYEVISGDVTMDGTSIMDWSPDERARAGLFLAFQYPVAIPGVTLANFLRTAINARRKANNPEDKGIPIPEFRILLKEKMDLLDMDHVFAGR
jgi:Fe-S cluster assembly ATP-binding protein